MNAFYYFIIFNFLDPEGGSQKATLVVVVISSLKYLRLS